MIDASNSMDDVLILGPPKVEAQKGNPSVNQTIDELQLEKFPEKTLIGRIERGFDFLGYHFGPKGLTLADKTISNFLTKALRLYDQEPLHTTMKRLGEYAARWVRWSSSGGIILSTSLPGSASLSTLPLCLFELLSS